MFGFDRKPAKMDIFSTLTVVVVRGNVVVFACKYQTYRSPFDPVATGQDGELSPPPLKPYTYTHTQLGTRRVIRGGIELDSRGRPWSESQRTTVPWPWRFHEEKHRFIEKKKFPFPTWGVLYNKTSSSALDTVIFQSQLSPYSRGGGGGVSTWPGDVFVQT